MIIKNKEINWENNEFKVIKFDKEKYDQMNHKHLYYIIECKHCRAQFTRKKEALKNIIHCPNCCHARNGSNLSTALYDMLIHYKNNARTRNIEWQLTEEQYKKLVKDKCYYCGAEPSERKGTIINNKIELVNGIDRIDSSKGYSIENCVSCCAMCNKMKNNYSQQQFLDKICAIYHNIKSSTTILKKSTLQANGNGNGGHLNKDEDIVSTSMETQRSS